MKKFLNRMKGVLPEGEIPLFISAIEDLQSHPRKSLRLNPLARFDSVEKLRAHGMEIESPVPWCQQGHFFKIASLPQIATHPLVVSGSFFIQEAGAMEPVENLDVKPGHDVLDLCAAPGAKSTQMGEKLKGQGQLVSNDPHRERARTLSFLLSRHGISNSSVYSLEPHELSPRFVEKFDRILIDAPCSGESLFAKRQEKRFDVSDREVKRCAQRQLAILNEASKMAKVGARMVYSTCTYSREENESVVEAFLNAHPEFRCSAQKRRWPHRDQVAGGYLAVLEKVSKGSDMTVVESQVKTENSTHGLIRQGTKRWDGEDDFYTIAMDRVGEVSVLPEIHFEKSEIEKARRFITGDTSILGAPQATGLYRIFWNDEVIGVAERTEKSWNHRTPSR